MINLLFVELEAYNIYDRATKLLDENKLTNEVPTVQEVFSNFIIPKIWISWRILNPNIVR